MAFDGIAVASLTHELTQKLTGGRITKISQPETDELLFTIKNNRSQYRLLISANPGLPLVYLTDKNKPSPVTAPGFCMLLRKHIGNGRITRIYQPGLERIIVINIEHLDELGDIRCKKLIVELMGKHSNIIFCDEHDKIIDSIKHVNSIMSSFRQVLPGRDYFIPDTMGKKNPIATDEATFINTVFDGSEHLAKSIYTKFTGISPAAAQSLCCACGADSDIPASSAKEIYKKPLYECFVKIINKVENNDFQNIIYYKNGLPVEFSAISLSHFSDCECRIFDSMSLLLETFYAEKNAHSRIMQKSYDLRRIVATALERDYKKYDMQCRQLKNTEKREKYKVYGELITAFGYGVEPGSKNFEADNYYTGEKITIPLDPDIPIMENAKKYFARYNKLKRTYEALSKITKETKSSIDYLESVSVSLDMASDEEDLKAIRDELLLTHYIKYKSTRKKEKYVNKPLHYISDDGFDIYVGKNNIQNEEITFKLADGGDWWFHAKGMPGSHVIIKSGGAAVADATFEQAAKLAGFYSKGKNQTKVDIDYTLRKNIKKVPGANPGFVIYHTNYSMSVVPDITGIKKI